ncbi:MAG: hypothetical protein JNK65_08815, partial [Deltaproteobacteria bacterium]|nr:hypothetical protein [Deltaproteobacteria bacterium]
KVAIEHAEEAVMKMEQSTGILPLKGIRQAVESNSEGQAEMFPEAKKKK